MDHEGITTLPHEAALCRAGLQPHQVRATQTFASDQPTDVEGCRMFCDFTDDDRYDAWKALVASAIGGVLMAGLLNAILWLW